MTLEIRYEEQPPLEPLPRGELVEVHMDPLTGENEAARTAAYGSADQRQALPLSSMPPGWERTGRNAPCPCGSGKKFKHCHGALL